MWPGAHASACCASPHSTLTPTRGLVRAFGKDTSALQKSQIPALRRRIGIVFQDFRLLQHLTTYENVALPLRVAGQEEGQYRSDVVELLKWVGLGERMHVLPPVLSGGEKQRAAIARALISKEVGDSVEVNTPGGGKSYEILDVKFV